MVHPQKETLCKNDNEPTIATRNNKEDLPKRNIERKKPDPKKSVLNDIFIYKVKKKLGNADL